MFPGNDPLCLNSTIILNILYFKSCFLYLHRCLVEDGTGEAMLFIEDHDLVRQMLFLKDSTWLEIKNMSRKHGEVWYQRSAYWKVGNKTQS